MTKTTELLRTPLFDWHVAHGGRMVDFALWSMPVQYTSITAEHQATRTAVGLFDISHMGRLQFFGPGAARFLDAVVTRRVADMRPGQIRYGLVCNASGGILDDILVYRLPIAQTTEDDSPTFQMVVNASNRVKIVDWLAKRITEYATHMADVTTTTAMIAVQGPHALRVVQPLVSCDLSEIKYYSGTDAMFADAACFVSRTGYTGEDGCEIICSTNEARDVWARLISASEPAGGMAVGLGARDTLRLEAAMPLYGHELSESINPIQAGLVFAVNFGQHKYFVGREALERAAADPNQSVRVGLVLEGKRVPRQGESVILGDEVVGEVTSGTFSPTFERPIAMAYVRPTAQAVGTKLTVDIRGTNHPATIAPLPFYERGQRTK